MADDDKWTELKEHVTTAVAVSHDSLSDKIAAIDAKVDKQVQWVVHSHYTALIVIALVLGSIALGAWLF